jgi:hypothetical protein
MRTKKPEPRYPWDRLDEESSIEFTAFAHYRDMHPKVRSLATMCQDGRYPLGDCTKWSVKFKWDERSQAWDDHQDKSRQLARLKAIEDLTRRQAQQAYNYTDSIASFGKELIKRIKSRPKLLMEMKDTDLIDLVMRGASSLPRLMEAERVAMGINPTMNVNVDVSKLSDEELEKIARGSNE